MIERVAGVSVVAALGLFTVPSVEGQGRAIEPDLPRLAQGKGLQVFNRSASALSDGARKGLRLSEQPGDGVAYLEGGESASGTIEVDVRVKDVPQHGFAGIALHALDEA